VLSKLRSKLTYANVMATVAVFMALGGGAYAAVKLPANSVGSKQIKKKAVTPSKVAPATVKLFKGQKGDQGATGGKGDPGPPGQPGARGSDVPGVMLTGGAVPSAATTTFYDLPVGASASNPGTTTESNIVQLVPSNATVLGRDLTVKLNDPLPVGSAVAYTLRMNRADTPVTCTIVGPATTCNSGAATQTIAPGSEVSIKVQTGASDPGGSHNAAIGWRATTP
jgi:hypothetical protein